MENMKTLITYSSLTGNTKKVAEGIYKVAPKGTVIASVEDDIDPKDFDYVLLGFWVDKGTADEKARRYIEKLDGKKVGTFATLGAYPDSQHAKDSMKKTRELIEPRNKVVAEFICHGKVDPRLIEKFKNFPAGNPHALTEERKKRHEEASKHPDERDIINAQGVFKKLWI